jgi:hypothetical protein
MRTALGLTLAAGLLAFPALADDEVRHAFSASVPRGAVRRVVIDIPAGEVDIRNGDASTISISGEARRSFDGYRYRSRQQDVVDDITAVIRVAGDEAVIERRYGPNAGSWSARSFHTNFKVRVEVPRGTDVEVGTRYGELNVDGEFGDLDIDLRAGEAHVRTPRASVRDLQASVRVGEVHADLGEERVTNEGLFPGSTKYYNSNGRSRIRVHATAGEVHVTLTR